MRTKIAVFALVPIIAASLSAEARNQDVRDAIVKIYTVHNRPNYYNPWATDGPRRSTGSGTVISGRRILTNGHVVSDQTFIQIRRNGEAKRYQARLLAVSHEADLALLTVDDDAFFEGIEPVDFGELPNTQQEVLVYGFPLGGDTLSITKGVLSRIEHQTYVHSSCTFLAGQIDAAINPGNSGGPVIVDDRIVGVVMQGNAGAENIGYMVPVAIVQHFFDDIDDGEYAGFPSLGVVLQEMENPSLKSRHRLTEKQTGVLITRILPGSPAAGELQVGDVVRSVAGHDVADDATVEFRPRQRTSVSYYVQERQVGETIDVGVWRDGEPLMLNLSLDRSMRKDWLIQAEEFDIRPTYYIYGGVVFCPLTKNLLREWGAHWFNKAPKELVAMLSNNFPLEDRDEIVIVLKVLAADVNQGYHNISNWAVDEVNGVKIRNLLHLIDLIEVDSDSPYMEFKSEVGQMIVLDREKVAGTQDGILALYGIDEDRSPDLSDADPPVNAVEYGEEG